MRLLESHYSELLRFCYRPLGKLVLGTPMLEPWIQITLLSFREASCYNIIDTNNSEYTNLS